MGGDKLQALTDMTRYGAIVPQIPRQSGSLQVPSHSLVNTPVCASPREDTQCGASVRRAVRRWMGRLMVGARRRHWPPRAGDGGTEHLASVLCARSAAMRPPAKLAGRAHAERKKNNTVVSLRRRALCEKKEQQHNFPAPQRDRLRRNREKWHAEKSVREGRVSGDQ